jgi:hypothetical protein
VGGSALCHSVLATVTRSIDPRPDYEVSTGTTSVTVTSHKDHVAALGVLSWWRFHLWSGLGEKTSAPSENRESNVCHNFPAIHRALPLTVIAASGCVALSR